MTGFVRGRVAVLAVRRAVATAVAAAVATAVATASGCAGGGTAASPQAKPGSTESDERGTVWSTGLNTHGQLGRPSERITTELGPVQSAEGAPLRDVVAAAAGGRHSIAVLADGRVVSWGANDHGQLGDGTRHDRDRPVPVSAPDGRTGVLTDVTAVAADSDFSMALRRDGTVVTWGKGDAGQRGIGVDAGPGAAPLHPTTVLRPDGEGPLTSAVDIAADGRTELVLLEDGTVLGWGANDYGMVGDGTTDDRSLPVPVRGVGGTGRLDDVDQISVGGQHGLALLRDGRVASWGYNDEGQLGDGTHRERHVPGLVRGAGGHGVLEDIVAVSSAEKHNVALRRDGTVVAWGLNGAGQLGDGTLEQQTTPVTVVGHRTEVLRGVNAVFAGEAYGVALLADGSVRAWGANGKGQLGSGDDASRARPGPVAFADQRHAGDTAAVATGERHLLLVRG